MDFQCDLRIVNGLLVRWRDLAAGTECATAPDRGRENKKAGTRPAFRNDVTSVAMINTSDQYLATTGPPKV